MKQIAYPIVIESGNTAIAASGNLVVRHQLQLDYDVKVVGITFAPAGALNNVATEWGFKLQHVETGVVYFDGTGGVPVALYQTPILFKTYGLIEPFWTLGSNLEATFFDLTGAGIAATVNLQAILMGVQNVH